VSITPKSSRLPTRRISTLREGREADERQAELDAAREREHSKELEQEREVHARRDRGHDYGL
jgi:hypothetical protein